MQMNQALFLSSGQCGYVLQPANMRDDIFDPFDKSTLRGVEPLSISIEVRASLWLLLCGRTPRGLWGASRWQSCTVLCHIPARAVTRPCLVPCAGKGSTWLLCCGLNPLGEGLSAPFLLYRVGLQVLAKAGAPNRATAMPGEGTALAPSVS